MNSKKKFRMLELKRNQTFIDSIHIQKLTRKSTSTRRQLSEYDGKKSSICDILNIVNNFGIDEIRIKESI